MPVQRVDVAVTQAAVVAVADAVVAETAEVTAEVQEEVEEEVQEEVQEEEAMAAADSVCVACDCVGCVDGVDGVDDDCAGCDSDTPRPYRGTNTHSNSWSGSNRNRCPRFRAHSDSTHADADEKTSRVCFPDSNAYNELCAAHGRCTRHRR